MSVVKDVVKDVVKSVVKGITERQKVVFEIISADSFMSGEAVFWTLKTKSGGNSAVFA